MGRGILRGAGGDENLKFNFIWPNAIINNSSSMVYTREVTGRSYLILE